MKQNQFVWPFLDVLVSAACRWCRNWLTLIIPIRAKGNLPPVQEANLKEINSIHLCGGRIEMKCNQPDNPTQTLILIHGDGIHPPALCWSYQKLYLYHKILTVNSAVWWFGMVLVVQSWLVSFSFCFTPQLPSPPSRLGALRYWCWLCWLSRKHNLLQFCVWICVGRKTKRQFFSFLMEICILLYRTEHNSAQCLQRQIVL